LTGPLSYAQTLRLPTAPAPGLAEACGMQIKFKPGVIVAALAAALLIGVAIINALVL